MAVTKLDPKAALVIIDLQKGIVSYPTAHPIGDVVKHAAELAAAFRRHDLPVVLVNVAGGAPGPHGQSAPDWRTSRRLDRADPRAEPPAAGPCGDQADLGRLHRHRA